MNLEFELLQDKGDAPFAMDILRYLFLGQGKVFSRGFI